MRKPLTAEQARHDELLEALKLLRNGADPVRVLERLSQRLTNKLLHSPLKSLA